MFKSLIALLAIISINTYAQDYGKSKNKPTYKKSISYINGFEDPISALSNLEDYKCENGNQERTRLDLNIKNNKRYRNGSFYGASSAGNLVSVNVLNEEVYIQIFLCDDVEKMSHSGYLMSMVLDSSQNCIIDQVSALNVNIAASHYNLNYAFFPIDFKGENPFCAQKMKIDRDVYGENSSEKANTPTPKSKSEIMKQIMVTKE